MTHMHVSHDSFIYDMNDLFVSSRARKCERKELESVMSLSRSLSLSLKEREKERGNARETSRENEVDAEKERIGDRERERGRARPRHVIDHSSVTCHRSSVTCQRRISLPFVIHSHVLFISQCVPWQVQSQRAVPLAMNL